MFQRSSFTAASLTLLAIAFLSTGCSNTSGYSAEDTSTETSGSVAPRSYAPAPEIISDPAVRSSPSPVADYVQPNVSAPSPGTPMDWNDDYDRILQERAAEVQPAADGMRDPDFAGGLGSVLNDTDSVITETMNEFEQNMTQPPSPVSSGDSSAYYNLQNNGMEAEARTRQQVFQSEQDMVNRNEATDALVNGYQAENDASGN
jgi:hypothetical protein